MGMWMGMYVGEENKQETSGRGVRKLAVVKIDELQNKNGDGYTSNKTKQVSEEDQGGQGRGD